MKCIAKPSRVEVVSGVDTGKVVEHVALRIAGRVRVEASIGQSAAYAEQVTLMLTPQEALELLEQVTGALAQLDFDVVESRPEPHGRRRK